MSPGDTVEKTMRLQAETAAHLLLQNYHHAHPDWINDKTPVDALVAWLDLHVATFNAMDYPAGTYGFIDPDENENLIWLCRDLPETLRRFTLAHELGHIVLHCHGGRRLQELLHQTNLITQSQQLAMPHLSRLDPCDEMDMTGYLYEEQSQEVLGLGQSYDPRSQRELAANFFAAELLLPLERIHARYLVERVSPDELTTIFGVSPTALLNRLAGLLKPPSITYAEVPSTAQASPPAKKHYDEFQLAAIQTSTPALIIAGPGSGKTSTLIGRIDYLIDILAIPPEHILALTFSRKATQEMEDRLRQVLAGQTQIIPKVSTFHAFCADLLRQYAPLAGLRTDFDLVNETEGFILLRQLAHQMHLHHYQQLWSPTHYFPDILKAISRAKDELVSPSAYLAQAQQMFEQAQDQDSLEQAEKALEIAHIYALYEQELKRRGDSDFGGLLMLTLELFHAHPEILSALQQKYQHILVDEFQDLNRASGVLLRELAGTEQHVWVVGDANQAIYSFRGASPANITHFTTDFPGAVILPLSRNYRSRPDLVTIAESFRTQQLEPNDQLGKNQSVRPQDAEISVTLASATDEVSEMAGILQDIRQKHTNGYAYKDIVILCRRRAQVQKMATALAQAGLPVTEHSSTLEQEYIKDLLAILLLLIDPTGMGLLRIARQPSHPFTPQDIETLLLTAHMSGLHPRQLLLAGEANLSMSTEGRHTLILLSHILQTLQRAPDIWSLLTQYLFIETSHIRDMLVSPESKQRKTMLADYDRLLQCARHFDQQQLLHAKKQVTIVSERNQDNPPLPSLEERIKGFLEYLTLLVLLRQDGGNRQSNDASQGEHADLIRVMTVHASKGLEFPIVYLPELVQQRFPFRGMPNAVVVPKGILPEAYTEENAHETSEACLFYVGITRAQKHLILTSSDRYGKKACKRSRYLDALEVHLPTERISRLRWDHTTLSTLSPDTLLLSHLPSLANADQAYAHFSSQPSENFINAMEPSTISLSAIKAYQYCPRQYVYNIIYHFSGSSNAYYLFIQAIRKTLKELHKLHQCNNISHSDSRYIPTQQEIQTLFTHYWQELNGHTTPFTTLYERHGHQAVEALRRTLLAHDKVNWDLSLPLQVEIAGTLVDVTIDRVETAYQTNTPARFVHTRFGKSKEKPTAETRELLYVLAYRQQHPGQSVELHSHNVSTDEHIPIKLTQKKEQSLYERAAQAIKGLQQHNYPAQPSQPLRCASCPFYWICPA